MVLSADYTGLKITLHKQKKITDALEFWENQLLPERCVGVKRIVKCTGGVAKEQSSAINLFSVSPHKKGAIIFLANCFLNHEGMPHSVSQSLCCFCFNQWLGTQVT